MGRSSRERPMRLSAKLLEVRNKLGLSQEGMLRALGLADRYGRHYISGFERGEREPPLTVLLRYSQVSKVWLNALVDDEIDLPEELPAREMHGGFKRRNKSLGSGRKV